MTGPDQRAIDPPAPDAYRELFERSADAILIIEGETFVDCNDAAVRMLRCRTKEQVLETHPSELSPPWQPDGRESFEKANAMIAIAFQRGSHRFEWMHRRADGEVFPVEVLLTAVQEPGRRTLHVVWRDVTERKLLEEQLRQALKMEALGKLTGGIAHDFNNLLVSVLGNAEELEDHLRGDRTGLEHVRGIRLAGERAADLVRQLLAFGRKQVLLPTVLDLDALLSEARTLVERLVGESVTLEYVLDSAPFTVEADRSQLEQVLLNLAANARDAMPDGGLLRVTTARRVVGPEQGRGRAALPAGDYVRWTVEDTGTGMDVATVRAAFDPFFTTKPSGRGTGLGLSTVYGIVHQSGGRVALHSDLGEGTVVEVLLPASVAPTPDVEEEAPVAASTCSATILLAEDEVEVARIVERALTGQGYLVLTCRDGREALATFLEHAGEVDLVLTDVIMPRMGGVKLVRALRELGHAPRVLFMSGYADEGLAELQASEPGLEPVEKPFRPRQLLERVRRALT